MNAGPSRSLAEWTVLALISQAPAHGFAICQLTAPDGELGRIWHVPRPVIYRSIGRGLFNLTGITNRDSKETELWDTWIVGAPIAGQNVDTTLTVAVIDDLNHDGIFNDAPNVVADLNHDERIDAADLKLLGVASNIVTVPFRINGDPAQP